MTYYNVSITENNTTILTIGCLPTMTEVNEVIEWVKKQNAVGGIYSVDVTESEFMTVSEMIEAIKATKVDGCGKRWVWNSETWDDMLDI